MLASFHGNTCILATLSKDNEELIKLKLFVSGVTFSVAKHPCYIIAKEQTREGRRGIKEEEEEKEQREISGDECCCCCCCCCQIFCNKHGKAT